MNELSIIINSDIVAGSRVFVEDNEAVEGTDDPWSVVDNNAGNSIKVNASPNWIPSLTAKKGMWSKIGFWITPEPVGRMATL